MSFIRFGGDSDPEKGPEADHYDRFIKKVKKRQLKNHGNSDELQRKKRKDLDESIVERDVLIDGRTSFKYKLFNNEFTRMGDHSLKETFKVKPALPNWITNPVIIPNDLKEISEKMPHFDEKITDNLVANNITNFFPVQQVVVPWIMEQFNKANSDYLPQDACVSAPTGSGKTLAYVIPIVQILLRRFVPRIRCVVVVPVQELAIQVANVFRSYTKGTHLKVAAIYGGNAPLKVEQQRIIKEVKVTAFRKKYETLVDILVITPGRLVEHLQKTKGFDLKCLKFLVIDEADRMMENIQNDWLFYLQRHLNNESISYLTLNGINKKVIYQKLLFSATMTTDPEKLKKLYLFQPVLFAAKNDGDEISKFVMPHELDEFYMVIEPYLKPAVIAELISANKWRRVLCFCKSAIEADRLSNLISRLCPEIRVRDISSKIPHRDLIVSQFSIGDIDVLISTDMMGRGIDIPNVRYVISYDPPKYFRGYVHRAGRTARAGKKGAVLTLLSKDQVNSFLHGLKINNKFNVSEMEISEESLENKSKYMEKIMDSFQLTKGLEKNCSRETCAKNSKKKRRKKKNQTKLS